MTLNRLTGLTLGAALVMASAVAAQTPEVAAEAETDTTATTLCGGQPAVWIGGTAEGSDLASADAPLAVSLSVSSDDQPSLFAFRIGEEPALALRIEAVAHNDGDPAIELKEISGATIESSDDAGGTLNSRIERALLPGDYCIAVNAMSGDSFEATLQVAQADQARLFPDVGPSAIAACTPDTPGLSLVEGDLNTALAQGMVAMELPGNQPSFLRFTLAAPQSLTLRASSDHLDPYIILFDHAGTRLAENDDADGLNARLDLMSVLGAGEYCLGVSAYRWGESTMKVSAEVLDEAAFMANAYRLGGIVPPLDGSYPVVKMDLATERQKPILLGGTAKWFSFDVDTASVLIIGAYGSLAGADPVLSLFGPHGEMIANNDDFGDSRDARLGPILLEAGRYSLALTNAGQGENAGAPIRPVSLVFDHFIRVP